MEKKTDVLGNNKLDGNKCSCVGKDVERGIIPFSWGGSGGLPGENN